MSEKNPIEADPWLAFKKAQRDVIIHLQSINMPPAEILLAVNVKSEKHIDRIVNGVPSPTNSDFAGL